jgi:hypothetical protein
MRQNLPDSQSARVITLICALIIALGFQLNILWRDIFDPVGIMLAGLLVGPVLLVFMDVEQWLSHHSRK